MAKVKLKSDGDRLREARMELAGCLGVMGRVCGYLRIDIDMGVKEALVDWIDNGGSKELMGLGSCDKFLVDPF